MLACFCRYLEDHENNPDMDRNETLGQFIRSHGYSQFFQEAYLVLLCSLFVYMFSVWSKLKRHVFFAADPDLCVYMVMPIARSVGILCFLCALFLP